MISSPQRPGLAAALVALLIPMPGRAAIPADYRGLPFDENAYRAAQNAEADRPALPFRAFTEALVKWNGGTSTNAGNGWVVGGATNTSLRLDGPDAEGKRFVHFHTSMGGYHYTAFGWNWATPEDKGVDLNAYAAVSFSIKVTGQKKPQELFFGFSPDQPAPVSIRPLQPSFADGGWHRVTIPIRALKWNPSSAAPATAEIRGFAIKTFVWNAADFDVFLDHFSFEREATPGGAGGSEPVPVVSHASHGQSIPGRIECAFYDLGGEGVAYHDTTPINILSAVLNQQPLHQRPHATPYHWNFRKDEGVDISFTKDFADLNHTNLVEPPVNQLYIGGTEDGEWCNYTVNVKKAGVYKIIAGYGNVAGMKPLRFSIDGIPAAECPCPVVTTSMHKWTREEIGRVTFSEAGPHLLTLHYERGYNLGFFDFEEAR